MMQIDENNFFVAQVVPEIYLKNTSFKIRCVLLLLTVRLPEKYSAIYKNCLIVRHLPRPLA